MNMQDAFPLDNRLIILYDDVMSLIHKQAFIRFLSKKNRRPQQHFNEALTEILDGIKDQLKEGKRLQFPGFGTFYTRTQKARKGMNIKTKQKIDIPEMRLASFKVGNVLKRAVRGKKLPEKKKGLISKIASFGKKSKKA